MTNKNLVKDINLHFNVNSIMQTTCFEKWSAQTIFCFFFALNTEMIEHFPYQVPIFFYHYSA